MAKRKTTAKKTKKVTAKITSRSAVKKNIFVTLNKWNIAMAGLHALQGILILVFSKGVTFPVTINHLTTDSLASQAAGHTVLAPATQHLFDINVAYLVVAFFFLSAIAHGVIATVYRQSYEKDLKQGINKARWIEYGLSASTMIVAIGLISGIYDLGSLKMLFALTLVMNLLGLVMEVHNQATKKTNWLSFIVGCVAGIVPWGVIAMTLWAASVYGSGQIPSFVYWIYASMFVFFSSFAVNMFLQYKKKGRWADYLYGERVYMVLSLVAKSVLAWQVFFGSLRP